MIWSKRCIKNSIQKEFQNLLKYSLNRSIMYNTSLYRNHGGYKVNYIISQLKKDGDTHD